MKQFMFLILIMLFSVRIFAQNEYKRVLDEQGIQVFAKELECHDNQNGIHQLFYALQWVNNSNESIVVSWNVDYWMNGVCVTCDKPKTIENTYVLHLSPGESVEGSCDKNSPKGTKIYIQELYNKKSSVLSKFEIVNLKVNIQ